MNSDLQAAIWGAVCGALGGGFASYVRELFLDKKRRRQMLADQYTDLSVEFISNVQAYWSSSGLNEGLQASILAGHHKIRGKLVQLGFDLVNDSEIRLLIKEMHQFSTGGTFSTKARIQDLERIRNTQSRIDRLTLLIQKR